MELEMKDELGSTVERLAAAAGLLEQAVERLAQRQNDFAVDAEASIGRIVATVEGRREAELEAKLAAAEAQIAELKAAASVSVPASVANGRKTLPVAMVNLLAKQGVTVDSMEAGAVDAALVSLSIEQRIAVKAQLMRAGLLG
jgi:phosphoserine phosphatase